MKTIAVLLIIFGVNQMLQGFSTLIPLLVREYKSWKHKRKVKKWWNETNPKNINP